MYVKPTDKHGKPIDGSNPLFVQLTGSNAIDDMIGHKQTADFTRQVRSANDSVTLQVPPGARGVIMQIRIYGVTGTFDTGQGISAEIGHMYGIGAATASYQLTTEKTSSSSSNYHEAIMYPGAGVGGALTSGVRKGAVSGLPLPEYIALRIQIDGTFAPGEGFDCAAVATWIY